MSWKNLTLSLVLHILFIALLMIAPRHEKPENVTIDFIEQAPHKKSKERTVIRDIKIPDIVKKEQSIDPWRFLSEKTQSVKEQTRALKSGMTKNRSLEKHSISKIKIPSPQDYQKDLETGVSTFGNVLPVDVKFGQMTVLNTDRYLYYSYFARAEELLRHEWEPMIFETLDKPPHDLVSSIHSRFTSIVEVWFHPSGKYHSSHLLKSSGVQSLDYAATESFRKVQMIPNPPKERVEKDGFIRFQWSLTVVYNPKALAKEQKE